MMRGMSTATVKIDGKRCPHCTHEWKPRVKRPTRCPKCWRVVV